MAFLKISSKFAVLLLILVMLLASTASIAENNAKTQPTHPTTQPISNTNPAHSTTHPNPANISFIKGLNKAREIVTAKTQFKLFANTSNPLYIWGDKGYSIQNSIQLNSIVEYNDTNNNQIYDQNEIVKTLTFNDHADWNFSQEQVNDSFIIFSLYTVNINQSGFENVQFNLTQYMFSNSNSMKFDIIISNWNWTSPSDRIAVLFDYSLLGINGNSGVHMSEHSANSNDNNSQEGLFINNKANQTIGYFLSSGLAHSEMANETLSVKNQFKVNNNNTALLIINYPYFGNYLFHDPVIGSNGDTVTLIEQLYTILIEQNGLLEITSFLSVLSLLAIFYMRRRK